MGFITRSQQAKARQRRLVLCKLARVERSRQQQGRNLLTEESCSAQGAVRDIGAAQRWLAEGWTVRQCWGWDAGVLVANHVMEEQPAVAAALRGAGRLTGRRCGASGAD